MRAPEPPPAPHALLLDLDGTFADTFPDLIDALRAVLADAGVGVPEPEQVRHLVSVGGRRMVAAALGVELSDPAVNPLHQRFLDRYRIGIARRTRLFPGIEQSLAAVEARGLVWGIVTNKLTWLSAPLIDALGYAKRSACLVCGDTAAHAKPHPDPLLHAARLLGLEPAQCAYLGDAAADVRAARAAGMRPLVAAWGYLGPRDDPSRWGAETVLDQPADLIAWLDAANTTEQPDLRSRTAP